MKNRSTPRLSPRSWALGLCLASAVASAQDDQHLHEPKTLDSVEVTASPLRGTAEDLARPVEVLAGEKLDEAKANSLGETVGKLPGVQSSYFGPGVGRPIIRGLDGARVQVLSGGLGSGDVSTVSADHAVTIEPFLAEQIEVLKGPATLLYGSGAIGGAVNVVDGRIPETMPDQPLQGRAEVRGGSVNHERTGMLRLDGGTGTGLAFHFDALWRETDDYEIPHYAESAGLLAEEGETPDPAMRGILPNSALRNDSAAIGASWIGTRGFIGAGYSLFNTRYGIPGHAHEEPHGHGEGSEEHEEAGTENDVRIAMDQRRTELRGGLDDLGPFASLRVKFASTDYTHTEFEGRVIGTVFDNRSDDARLELVHAPWGTWRGAFGLQWGQRDFDAVGDEAFVPPTQGDDLGLFYLGEREFGALKLEIGARHDRNRVQSEPHPLAPLRRATRKFNTNSLSGALRWEIDDGFHVSLGLDRAQRSPTAEELYSNGLHVATARIEIGDDNLRPETAHRVEVGAHWHSDRVTLGMSLYSIGYDDFIYLAGLESVSLPGTQLTVDGTAVNLWVQNDARFHGAEAEADFRLFEGASGDWNLRIFGDYVRGRLDGEGTRDVAFQVFHEDHTDQHAARLQLDGNLPRIAAPRAGAELRWKRGGLRLSLGGVHYFEQDDVAVLETTSADYTLVDAHAAWHIDTPAGHAWELFADGNNLLDAEARPHTSFLRNMAPPPGRGVTFGIRTFF